MIKYLLERYYKHLKVWGCKVETYRPPELIITQHGKERMLERIGCLEKNIEKVVTKAWLHGKPISTSKVKLKKRRPKHIYKEYMGCCFVFEERTRQWFYQHVLITVWKADSYKIYTNKKHATRRIQKYNRS